MLKNLENLSLEELRMFFGEQRTSKQRAEAFVRERFLGMQEKGGIKVIPDSTRKGALVVHLIPLDDFEKEHRNEIPITKNQRDFFMPIFSKGRYSVNLKGYQYSSDEEYTQVFRDGSLESVSLFPPLSGEEQSEILLKNLTSAIIRYMNGFHKNKVSIPVLLQISIMNIEFTEFRQFLQKMENINLFIEIYTYHHH